ncbi:hypothetical protein MT325_m231R [Paramecium bursaria chlorella virus MT325]|uniref:Uncharacterized protein m231R n=1 Tax=Paramecium bursaria Chlorella virus MT325 TaxID=346932 RepID=A7ITW1_PBCVM|nr:hypothetical protein MT325_m231R [Paramecium bursaria chlorella virus MT325]
MYRILCHNGLSTASGDSCKYTVAFVHRRDRIFLPLIKRVRQSSLERSHFCLHFCWSICLCFVDIQLYRQM